MLHFKGEAVFTFLPLKLPKFRKCIINTFSIDYHLWKASPKAANIHNRWLSCRRQRSLRFKE